MGALCEQAGVLYNILLETQACEVSQRIIAMDNASTNAGEMVGRFTLFYNRYDWAPHHHLGVAFFLPLLVLYRRGCLTVFCGNPLCLVPSLCSPSLRHCSARQAKITTELSEIISGSESLKDENAEA